MDAWTPIVEQWQRTLRWHQRLQTALTAASGGAPDLQTEADDLAMAFFLNCYHLKDWLIEARMVDKARIRKEFIQAHLPMQVCRDLANGAKHLSLRQPSLGPTHSPRPMIVWTDGQPYIELQNQAWPLPALAEACLGLWQDYLTALGYPS